MVAIRRIQLLRQQMPRSSHAGSPTRSPIRGDMERDRHANRVRSRPEILSAKSSEMLAGLLWPDRAITELRSEKIAGERFYTDLSQPSDLA